MVHIILHRVKILSRDHDGAISDIPFSKMVYWYRMIESLHMQNMNIILITHSFSQLIVWVHVRWFYCIKDVCLVDSRYILSFVSPHVLIWVQKYV